MADKCWCETAKEDIEKAYKNPNPYHGALQDIMDAEIDYARMCSICPCRKRRLERGEEPVEKKPKEVESESDGPAADNQEIDKEDEDSKSETSLLITEFDPDEEPEEDDPRDVEEEPRDVEEDEEGETPPPPAAGSPPCSCDFPLLALKQALEEWAENTPEAKDMSNQYQPLYEIAHSKWFPHEYEDFSWNFPLF